MKKEINYDKALNEINRLKMDEEYKRRLDIKEHMRKDAQYQLQLIERNKMEEKEKKDRERDDYKSLLKENMIKEMVKDENYKNVNKS